MSTNPTFFVELQDEDGNTISTEHTDIITKEQLELVFSLSVKETASVIFIFDKTEGASRFKVSSKWDESNDGNSVVKPKSPDDIVHQAAVIDDSDGWTNVRATPNGTIVTKIYEEELFYFDEVPDSKWYRIYRTGDASAECIGYMHCSCIRPIGDKGATKYDSSSSSNYGNNTSLTIDDNGDSSYDEFFEEYERFWRKYINFIKKMDKNDPSAMVEYAQLLQEYQRYSEKLTKIKGKLSVSQINRLNKMNAELIEEMSKIQH